MIRIKKSVSLLLSLLLLFALTAPAFAADSVYAGAIHLADMPKSNAKDALAQLRGQGVKKTVLLTGDNERAARKIGQALGLDEIHAEKAAVYDAEN